LRGVSAIADNGLNEVMVLMWCLFKMVLMTGTGGTGDASEDHSSFKRLVTNVSILIHPNNASFS
jgi:hypothetical protein